MKLLLLEDDLSIAATVTSCFEAQGWLVTTRHCGSSGLAAALQETYNALILDRGLPTLDGMTVLKLLRAAGNAVPTLFITNMATTENRVEGLDAGADYLVKPFAMEELVARVKRLGNTPPPANSSRQLQCAGLRLDCLERTVFRGDDEIVVTAREFKLMEFLIAHKNTFVSKRMLLEGVWGIQFEPKTSVVQTQISRLKSKLRNTNGPAIIQTMPGGYMLSDTQ